MVKVSREALEVLGEEFLDSIRVSDSHARLRAVVDAGWMSDRGATLLSVFRESYFGDRANFPDVGSYEAAVKGRGIPDLDIDSTGDERTEKLMRRGVHFAWEALRSARSVPWAPTLLTRVSTAPVLMDPSSYTGYVTFFAAKFAGELGIGQGAELSGIQIILSSEDCVEPLVES